MACVQLYSPMHSRVRYVRLTARIRDIPIDCARRNESRRKFKWKSGKNPGFMGTHSWIKVNVVFSSVGSSKKSIGLRGQKHEIGRSFTAGAYGRCYDTTRSTGERSGQHSFDSAVGPSRNIATRQHVAISIDGTGISIDGTGISIDGTGISINGTGSIGRAGGTVGRRVADARRGSSYAGANAFAASAAIIRSITIDGSGARRSAGTGRTGIGCSGADATGTRRQSASARRHHPKEGAARAQGCDQTGPCEEAASGVVGRIGARSRPFRAATCCAGTAGTGCGGVFGCAARRAIATSRHTGGVWRGPGRYR